MYITTVNLQVTILAKSPNGKSFHIEDSSDSQHQLGGGFNTPPETNGSHVKICGTRKEMSIPIIHVQVRKC